MESEEKNSDVTNCESCDSSCCSASEQGECVVQELTLEQKVENLEKLCAEYKDQFFRARADLENARKRLARDREELYSSTIATVFSDIFLALDTFKLGISNCEKNGVANEVIDGFRLIYQQLNSCCEKNGIDSISPSCEAFDPNFHEAISFIHSDTITDGFVIDCVRTGYKFGKKLLRPASVVVSKGACEDSNKGN